jgi:hypothetical protein
MCPNCLGYSGGYRVQNDSGPVAVGQTASFSAWALRQDGVWVNVSCNHPSEEASTLWTSSNNSVAQPSSCGNFTTNSPGTFTATAESTLIDWPADCPEGHGYLCPTNAFGPGDAGGDALVVTISIKSSGTAALDDLARGAYQSATGTYNLGNFVDTNGFCSIGFEASGTVAPSTYTGTVLMVRTKGGANYKGPAGQTLDTSYPTGTDDTSDPTFEDNDPQSGGSNGVVYDLDAPGRQPATNEIWRKRLNFFENAQLPDGTYVANEVGFYVRLSCIWGSSGNAFATDVSGDNVLNLGSTPTSWNLQ